MSKNRQPAMKRYAIDHPYCEVCEFLGIENVPAVDVHHIKARSALGNEDPRNLISLGRFYHDCAEGNIKGIKASECNEHLLKIKRGEYEETTKAWFAKAFQRRHGAGGML